MTGVPQFLQNLASSLNGTPHFLHLVAIYFSSTKLPRICGVCVCVVYDMFVVYMYMYLCCVCGSAQYIGKTLFENPEAAKILAAFF